VRGQKTGGRKAGRPNNSTLERQEIAAETVALIGELIPDAFAGDAHAFLVAVYKDPRQDQRSREVAARAALPFEKPRPVTVTAPNEAAGQGSVRARNRPPAGVRLGADRPRLHSGLLRLAVPRARRALVATAFLAA